MTLKSFVFAYCPSPIRPLLTQVGNSPIGSRLAKGMFWSVVGAVISRGLMFIASIFVARILGKTGYGEFGMIQSTFGMFGIFAGFGLGITATKHVAQFRACDPARAGRIIGLLGLCAVITSGSIALLLFIFAPWLAVYTINAPHLDNALRIGVIILFINAVNGAQTGALSGFEAFKTITYVNLLVGLISFPILICCTYYGGLTGALWAMVINLGFNWVINHLALRKEALKYKVRLTLRNCRTEMHVLWRFSLPALLGSAMVGPVNWLCCAILVNQPGGYGEMGILSAANQWHTILLFLPSQLGSVILPVLAERLGQQDTSQSLKTLKLSIKVNAVLILPVILFACIASPYIMRLYGEEFVAGWPTLVVVLLTTGIIALQTPVGHIIAASGKMWTGLAMNSGWALLFILGTVLLLKYGALGLVLARAGGYAIHTIWVAVFVYHIFGAAKLKHT